MKKNDNGSFQTTFSAVSTVNYQRSGIAARKLIELLQKYSGGTYPDIICSNVPLFSTEKEVMKILEMLIAMEIVLEKCDEGRNLYYVLNDEHKFNYF